MAKKRKAGTKKANKKSKREPPQWTNAASAIQLFEKPEQPASGKVPVDKCIPLSCIRAVRMPVVAELILAMKEVGLLRKHIYVVDRPPGDGGMFGVVDGMHRVRALQELVKLEYVSPSGEDFKHVSHTADSLFSVAQVHPCCVRCRCGPLSCATTLRSLPSCASPSVSLNPRTTEPQNREKKTWFHRDLIPGHTLTDHQVTIMLEFRPCHFPYRM